MIFYAGVAKEATSIIELCALFFAFSLFCFCAFLAGEVNGGIPTV
jgi:hypothetical protein